MTCVWSALGLFALFSAIAFITRIVEAKKRVSSELLGFAPPQPPQAEPHVPDRSRRQPEDSMEEDDDGIKLGPDPALPPPHAEPPTGPSHLPGDERHDAS